jgi:hypothetical protein
MKKTKSMIGALLLSTVLAGNVFAGGTGSTGIYGIFESFTSSVISLFGGDDSCTTRQCPNCRPTQN